MRNKVITTDRGISITVRDMLEADCREVSRLEAAIFTMPWTEQDFRQCLTRSESMYLVTERQGRIIGYCGMHNIVGEGDITNVGVAEDERGRGIAYGMMAQALIWGREAGMQSFTLEVRAGNVPAIHIYEKLGFITEGRRKDFYEKPREDALIMWKRQEKEGTISNQI